MKIGQHYIEINRERPIVEWKIISDRQMRVVRGLNNYKVEIDYIVPITEYSITKWLENGTLVPSKENTIQRLLDRIDGKS